MRSTLVAAVLAVGAALGVTDTASAQYYGYNYRTYTNPVTGSVVSGQSVTTPFGAQSVTGYYNPWFGYGGQSYSYADAFGNQYRTSAGYNPYVGNYSSSFGYTNPYMSGMYGAYNPYLAAGGVPTPYPYLTSGNLSMYNASLINQQRYNAYMNNLYRGRR